MPPRKKPASGPSKQDERIAHGRALIAVVHQLNNEKNFSEEKVFTTIEKAIHLAIVKYYNDEEGISISINRHNGLIDAKKGEKELDLIGGDLGRIAAQAAKQAMIQMFREEESNSLVERWDKRKGELVQGTVQRFEGGAAVVQLADKSEALLPRSEQVPGEAHHAGDKVKAIVLEVKKQGNRVRIILSRSHPDFVRRLFEKEIPEIDDGTITIKAVAREAGHRSKVAVSSIDSKVDCVGACVGVRGSRIKNIVEVLGGTERIDIVRWNDSLQVLIPQALQPAEVEEVFLYDILSRAVVLVREDQLSLAIGRRGQNVRLASKLVDWEIEIMTHDELNSSIEKAEGWFRAMPGMPEEGVEVLLESGFMSYSDVAVLSPAELSELTGMSEDDAEEALIYAEEEAEKEEKEAKLNKGRDVAGAGAGGGGKSRIPIPSEPPPSEARQKFDSLFQDPVPGSGVQEPQPDQENQVESEEAGAYLEEEVLEPGAEEYPPEDQLDGESEMTPELPGEEPQPVEATQHEEQGTSEDDEAPVTPPLPPT